MNKHKQELRGKKRIAEGIRLIVEEAKATGEEVGSNVNSLGMNIKQSLKGALAARNSVVMVRLNEESVTKLDELVDSGLVSSRSEAAAFLVGQGIKASDRIFGRMSKKIAQIRDAKEELRKMLDDESPSE